MIHTFPTPYPDELLYSVFARYHVRSGNTSPKVTTEELFGKRSIRSVWDLPSNMDVLLRRLDSYLKQDYLLDQHTMFPYYSSFLLPKQAEQVRMSMLSNLGNTIHTRTGIAASNVKQKKFLWVCSSCIEEDVEKFGETYWHRVHQAPGVFFCPKHETILEETTVSTKLRNQHEYAFATPTIMRTLVDLSGLTREDQEVLLKIAHFTKRLLKGGDVQKKNNSIRDKYLSILKQRGLASPAGNLKREQLYHSFSLLLKPPCQDLLQSPIHLAETNWLTMIFRKHRKSFHPLRHILVLIFLEMTPEELYDKSDYRPFGKGPWLCLNPICSSYHKPCVYQMKIKSCYDTKRPVGTFSCVCCGFVFSRRGPDQEEADQYRVGTIKDYGFVWKNKLKMLVNEGLPLKVVAAEMHADPATVKKYTAEMSLEASWKPPKQKVLTSKDVKTNKEILTEKKERWLELQQIYPDKSKTELRMMNQDIYAYIYRNDREWLNIHSPVKKRVVLTNQRVNWKLRDKELLDQVKQIIETWDIGVNKLTRITVLSIGKKLNKLSLLQKKQEKLPLTMEYIHRVVEDIETFQMRRVEFTIKKLKDNDDPIIEWMIYRQAGLRSDVSREVKRLIALRATEYETTSGKSIKENEVNTGE